LVVEDCWGFALEGQGGKRAGVAVELIAHAFDRVAISLLKEGPKIRRGSSSAVPLGLAVFGRMDPAEVPGYCRMSLRDKASVPPHS
jgi:hypothetical protein